MTNTPEEQRSARRSEAVAPKAPAQAPATPALTCRTCGRKAVYETSDPAAEQVAYCRQHLPANVSKEMLARYKAR